MSKPAAVYPGDHTDKVGTLMGPNTGGEMLRVAGATFDGEVTRLEFDYVDPRDLGAVVAARAEELTFETASSPVELGIVTARNMEQKEVPSWL